MPAVYERLYNVSRDRVEAELRGCIVTHIDSDSATLCLASGQTVEFEPYGDDDSSFWATTMPDIVSRFPVTFITEAVVTEGRVWEIYAGRSRLCRILVQGWNHGGVAESVNLVIMTPES